MKKKFLAITITVMVGAALFTQDVMPITLPIAAAPPATECVAWLSPTAEIYAKIEPVLLKKLRQACEPGRYPDNATRREFRFIVHLWDEAELSQAKLHPNILARRRAVVTALQQTAERSQKSLRAYLREQHRAGEVLNYRPFWVVNAIAVTAPGNTVLDLARRADVKMIRADHKRYLSPLPRLPSTVYRLPRSSIEWGIEQIRAPLVWSTLHVTGTGVVVANMDTGVDWRHPALLAKYRGYNEKGLPVHAGNWFCATDEGYLYPGDGNGHGTHTMGTIVGANGIGVAPGARWIAVKIFHNDGHSYDSWIHAGFEWILAPDGDPALAPDVVNNSWGSNVGADETFRPDIQAWNAAGIVAVFSAGNDGPEGGTVGSPASFDETLAVGATTRDDEAANFSSRGPSPWGETKPNVAAPGTEIRSSAPGGGYQTQQGTSMAAPHVAGLVALLLQADPTLSVEQVKYVITSTAVPLGEQTPNNDFGWGRIDAYAAVATVAAAGEISGTVTRAIDGAPLPYATVAIADRAGGSYQQITGDANGHYRVFLLPGVYDLTAASFAYEPLTVDSLHVITRTPQTVDFALTALPTGVLFGRVVEEGTNIPLSATLTVSGTYTTLHTDAATGLYSHHLPAGEYTLRVESWGHRVVLTTGVRITVGQATGRDFALPPAPTILLVDSGSWHYRSAARYFQDALDDLYYLYDTWKTKRNVDYSFVAPVITDLLPYDIVIWSSPEDSPGYTGAHDAVTDYLNRGGKLFITGQDIGYWDGLRGYYRYQLRSVYRRDNAATRTVIGAADNIFAGITLTLNGGDSADNQWYPDEISPVDDTASAPICTYQDGGYAGQEIGLCLPHRAVYLAFGFEGIAGRDTRREVMERVITALETPPLPLGLRLDPLQQTAVRGETEIITHTLLVRNIGQTTEQYTWELADNGWQTEIMDGNFAAPLAPTLTLSSCQWFTIGVSVTASTAARFNLADQARFTLKSQQHPTIVQTALITSKLPAPILLVDDDRWYEREAYYQTALAAAELPYDYWDTSSPAHINDADSLRLNYLARYPLVLWFTAYDWHRPLTDYEEATLRDYLGAGGRLFFTSQDYLYYHGLNDFGRDYLGIAQYTEDITVTQVTGLSRSPIGTGLGPYILEYSYRDWSDEITPTASATGAFVDQRGQICAIANYSATVPNVVNFKSAFFAFPFDTLPADDAPLVLNYIVGWLSPLGDSALAVDKQFASTGDVLDYTITVRNTHPHLAVTATLSVTLPAHTSYVSGQYYDAGANRISWQDYLAPGDGSVLTYRVAIDPTMPDMSVITHTMYLSDDTGIHFTKAVTTAVNAPLLTASTKEASATRAKPDDVITYTITLWNTGTAAGDVTLTDVIPTYTKFVSGSLYASAGTAGVTDRVITWAGTIAREATVNLSYATRISVPRYGFLVVNHAVVTDGFNAPLLLEAVVDVRARVYLPLILKGD